MGLVLFLGYIIFDTQMIIENAHRGDLNYVNHALELFTDFVAVFVRILIIMVTLILPDSLFLFEKNQLVNYLIMLGDMMLLFVQLKNKSGKGEREKKKRSD